MHLWVLATEWSPMLPRDYNIILHEIRHQRIRGQLVFGGVGKKSLH
ncbi:hypothetical protein LINPERPRIM_LOCUS35470 [Linum perenne]